MTIDRHTLAVISIVGSSLDVLGALYLAYDLLGGEHGPLRTLTRAITYGILFGMGYGVVLGPVFGLASGAAHGITLAWEFSRASRHQPKPGFWFDVAVSAIRGCSYAVGFTYLYGIGFAMTFAALSTVGQILAYRAGIRPTIDYAPATKPRITKFHIFAVLNRTVGYAITGFVSALVGGHKDALTFGLEVGLVIGIVTAIAVVCTPFIEWNADHLPARRMGVFGVGLIFIGFALQSIQYWMTLLNVDVR
jgi:hypothetical protein